MVIALRAACALAVAAAAAAGGGAACSSGKVRAIEDAKQAGHGGSATGSGSGAGAGSGATPAASTAAPASPKLGEIQVRVEWRDVPLAARASPGKTPCGTPRAPAVAPTTTWGIPEAFVIVEGVDGAPVADAGEVRIVLADCALAPRAAAGSALVVESAVDRPSSVALYRRGSIEKLDELDGTALSRVLRLPVVGHEVGIPVDHGGVYELATTAKPPETAWVLISPNDHGARAIAVTGEDGQAVLRGVPPGSHVVTAWLPPRAGQPPRLARGAVTVVPGALAELTLSLGGPAATQPKPGPPQGPAPRPPADP